MSDISEIFCPVCGQHTTIQILSDNLRETGVCSNCRSFNRLRQVAHVICERYKIKSLPDLSALDLDVYLMESRGSLYKALSNSDKFVCSDFYPNGEVPDSAPLESYHVDIQNAPFCSDSFDLIISSDVFEHVPDAYQGFKEVYRILKKGGVHVFSVPFTGNKVDEVRAMPGPVHLMEAHYHGDPLRKEGSLVYRNFGLEMLKRLSELGMDTTMHQLAHVDHGIIGDDAIVFESEKE